METPTPHPQRLAQLSLSFDGSIPPERLRIACAQSKGAAMRGVAASQARFYGSLAESSRLALARLRAACKANPSDLLRLQGNLRNERDAAVGWLIRAEAWPE
ncbi:hypothetical protein MTBLM1_70096 [Rhodospirillaceae bacterium LM-1]|nr:hypothetical protein MTBLM1_70096 [Rhodospirillaceae bacterium LM-1]